jgi:ABC-type nitrate/sulfonate/bicarbonate transport system permease component
MLALVSMPAALPYVATGLRIASTIALVLAVTAELVIGIPGLGQSIALTQAGGAVPAMYALVIVTGVLGWCLNAIFLGLERRLLHWHIVYRPGPG